MTMRLALLLSAIIAALAFAAGAYTVTRLRPPPDVSAILARATREREDAVAAAHGELERATEAARLARVEVLRVAEEEHARELARLAVQRDILRQQRDRAVARLQAAPAPERTADLSARLGFDVACGDQVGPGAAPRCTLGRAATDRLGALLLDAEAAPASCLLEQEATAAGGELACARRLALAGEQAARREAALVYERDAAQARAREWEAQASAWRAAAEAAPRPWYAAPETWGIAAGCLLVGAGAGAIAWEVAR